MNIKDFIWLMCVSYRALNDVTQQFQCKIGRCSDDLNDIGDSHGHLLFISLDTRSGYH